MKGIEHSCLTVLTTTLNTGKEIKTRDAKIEGMRLSYILSAIVTVVSPSHSVAMVITSALGREIFSVAPMMAHTNRHYHYFFRLLSRRAHLYTEMIPANQIIAQFNNEVGTPGNILTDEQIMVVVNRPPREAGVNTLHELLRISTSHQAPLVLQLGGRDPEVLAQAAAIGAAFGYNAINLNCGCPSNAVSGGERGGGASHMNDPSHVAYCLERMSERISSISEMIGRRPVDLSVKHRLGVAEASGYDADADRRLDDMAAFNTCRNFINTITTNSAVSKLHVHARLGLLGAFDTPDSKDTALWVPGHKDENTGKVDHKREQYHAKKRARTQTIQNRSVPPLRPDVINMLAADMPHLEFVTNGGINSVDSLLTRLHGSPSNVVGAMVGRAVINHPCSFSGVDCLWGEEATSITRQSVLDDYIGYCEREEDRVHALQPGIGNIEALRRRLVAVPFQLFAGEEGSHQYQRRIRKLVSRPSRHSSYTILEAAVSEVPRESREMPVGEHTPIGAKNYFEFVQRSGPLQQNIM